jgi:hypothetical protein
MKLYFHTMDTADFATSRSLFADDAVYVRPPLGGTATDPFASSGTTSIEGLDAISDFWERRGKRETRHVIKIESATDSEWFAEGRVSVGDSEERLFLCHVTFDPDDKIKRFVAIR